MPGPVAITGATGFAGRHVVRFLGQQGAPMRLLMRKERNDLGFEGVEIVVGSLEDEASLKRLVAGAAAVVHIAGAIAARNRAQFFAVNAEATLRLADAAAAAGVRKFVHISSLAAREPELSDYGASKRAGEEMLALHESKLALTILRPPVIYGGGDRSSLPLFAQLTHQVAFLPGSPQSRFSLLYAGDLARAVARALEDGAEGVHEIDDGTVGGYCWPDLVKISATARGRSIVPIYLPRPLVLAGSISFAAMARFAGRASFLSPDKVRQLYHPDWVCRSGSFVLASPVRFAEGFTKTVQWYRERGWLPAPAYTDRTRPRSDEGELLS